MGRAPSTISRLTIPHDRDNVIAGVDGHEVRLTNLRKVFWPELGLTKGDLLQYYADVAHVLLPHIRDRAMVMKRYPHGASGDFFFMKRAPAPRPAWIRICSIRHDSGNVIDFPVIDDRASLMWVINLGCIDLNQWYARCDDVARLTASAAHDRGVPSGEAPPGARARGLQPERVGEDAGVDLFAEAATRGDRVDTGDVEGSGAGHPD